MVKHVVVNLPLRVERDAVTPYAASLAGYFNAALTGVAFVYEPTVACVEMGVGEARYIEAQDAEAEKSATAAIERLTFEVRRQNIDVTSHRIRSSTADVGVKFSEIARSFDLAVFAQSEPNHAGLDDLILETTLFDSGHPILVVPYIQTAPFELDRVAVCWDGSRAATRAIADAMPFLKRAHHVDLVTIGDELEVTAAMDEHLALHGVRAHPQRLSSATDIASTILNFAAETSPDLLVMGGYGHSRLREFVLGGATRGMLESMTVPTLMPH